MKENIWNILNADLDLMKTLNFYIEFLYYNGYLMNLR